MKRFSCLAIFVANLCFATNALNAQDYYEQFVGQYDINWVMTVDISYKSGSLRASIIGMPEYELLPQSDGTFQVQSFPNFKVNFYRSQDGVIQEAELITPDGKIYKGIRSVPLAPIKNPS